MPSTAAFQHEALATVVRRAAVVALPLALLTVVARPCRAQVVLEGRVVDDSSGRPISEAHVLLENRYGKTVGFQRTDSAGHFRFAPGENERYRLEARAVGYQPARRTILWMMANRTFAGLEVRLTPHATLLAPVEVVALSPPKTSPVLANMEYRRTHGFGLRISREQIEIRNPLHLTDILAETPGVRVDRQGSGSLRRVIHFGAYMPGPGGGDCPVQIWVDGMLATRNAAGGDVSVDDLVEPQDVEAIEIFKGLAMVPPEFLNEDARCGVIAIWTKRSHL
jgi:Carboxypeptidase regulatory-like domain/TonB-dependent Receptor Plug Domain